MSTRYFEYVGPPGGGSDGVAGQYTVGKVYDTPPVTCYPEPDTYGRFVDDAGHVCMESLDLFTQVEVPND